MPTPQAPLDHLLGKPSTLPNPKPQDALPEDVIASAPELSNAQPGVGAVPMSAARSGSDVPMTIPSQDAAPQPSSLFDAVVSGAFDLEEADTAVAEPRRILQPQADTPKLHKILAQSGMGSRLEMEQLILEGRISVNNGPRS